MSNELAVQEPSGATRPAKAPVVANERGVTFSTMDDMWRFCVACVNSNQFKDINTPEIALIRLQAGMELGLTPIWSLTNIMVTNGRPSVWGDGLLGIVLAQPTCEDVIETSRGTFPNDDYTAVCEVRRKGRAPVVREFSVADAKKANLFGKNVHATYPKRMLMMRARSWACRDAFADALRGLGVVEEQQDVEPKQAKAREVTGIVFPDEAGKPRIEAPAQQYLEGGDEQSAEPSLL